ncbi:hypothetical protein T310_1916 [Rasamsonia emersonii CBS 393.64]|uniref:Chromosome condensation protein (CrcB) n=1 Tax=Rasamsonia emersonii (strain ATCC 16479 / CBS 393.64 / IMI 116815) TaxID=1408163 RepID=A0A0F4Z0Y5_RASE3|nr:hypothetical protein T310_1916 [Rasamsonia emersonii CBS 393.64]KKA24035.1 hypothetical protein T310_1916 [Rasamsonia emersonii CBS 393.64]
MSPLIPASDSDANATQNVTGNEDNSLEMIQSSRSRRQEETGEAGDGYEAAPLSELLVQAPADWRESQQQINGAVMYGGERGTEGSNVPLAELVAGPPAPRLSHTSTRQRPPSRRPSAVSKREEGPPPVSKLATKLYTISYLIFFSILGTLARLGLQALTFYPGAPVVTGVLWANVGGCILMGFFIEDRNLFREEWGASGNEPPSTDSGADVMAAWIKKHKTVKKTIPLYIGLTTGFCGSFTSFSSFIRDAFLALSNDLPNPSAGTTGAISRNRGDSFMAVVAVIIVTVSLSMSSLFFGAHLAIALDPWTPVVPFRFTRKVLDRVVVLLAWGCWLGAVFMAIWPPDRMHTEETWRGRAIFALVFAPLGCLLRFYLSLYLNARLPAFPLGIGAAQVITSKSLLTSCQVLQGVMDGFCGCATTVSTWVAELHGLGMRRHAYVYGAASVGIALAFLVVIMGSLKWTIGFASP